MLICFIGRKQSDIYLVSTALSPTGTLVRELTQNPIGTQQKYMKCDGTENTFWKGKKILDKENAFTEAYNFNTPIHQNEWDK